MEGYRNYKVTLEHVTDSHIDTYQSYECATEKEAIKKARSLSKSSLAKLLKIRQNQFGEMPNVVRVFVSSNECDNDDFVTGTHIMIFEDGVCKLSTIG